MNEENIEVLLVEDNPRDAELTIRAFKRNRLADRLFHLPDGTEALDFLLGRAKYESRPTGALPRVILLDLKLPKMNGLEVLQRIKGDPELQTIPVVVVTSSAEDPDLEAAYQLGANSYVIKPVQFEVFMEAMSSLGIYWLTANHSLK